MINKQMEYLLGEALAIDVSEFPVNGEGDFILDSYIPSCQYCNAVTEQWIHSIGCDLTTMHIYASTTDKFNNRAGYQCLYLR
jgi:hypothetical protein